MCPSNNFFGGVPASTMLSSSTAEPHGTLLVVSSNEPGPDFADYPYDTVPNKVDQLFRAQRHHDSRQNDVSTHKNTRSFSMGGGARGCDVQYRARRLFQAWNLSKKGTIHPTQRKEFSTFWSLKSPWYKTQMYTPVYI